MTNPTVVPGHHDIELVDGQYLNLLDPDPKVISLDAIAHGLSNTCRYTGQTQRFYSVAEHACLVAEKLRRDGCPPTVQMAGLHHDDAEAFIADIARPLKSLLQPAYDEITKRLDDAIAASLGLLAPNKGIAMYEAVKHADDWALACETYHLMPSKGRGWFCEGMYDHERDRELIPAGGLGIAPGDAYETFCSMHTHLSAQRRQVA